MKIVKQRELTKENFKEFGEVISTCSGQPVSDNEESRYWGKVLQFNISENISTGILIGKKRDSVVCKLERHLKTHEMLVALEGDGIICVSKPSPKGTDEIEDIQAFHIKQGDAFVMFEGTWHWTPFPVNDGGCRLLVIFASGTEENDLEVKNITEEIKIV